jgi:hypothetical protein
MLSLKIRLVSKFQDSKLSSMYSQRNDFISKEIIPCQRNRFFKKRNFPGQPKNLHLLTKLGSILHIPGHLKCFKKLMKHQHLKKLTHYKRL